MNAPATPEELRAAPASVTVRAATSADADTIAAIHVAGYEDAYRGLRDLFGINPRNSMMVIQWRTS